MQREAWVYRTPASPSTSAVWHPREWGQHPGGGGFQLSSFPPLSGIKRPPFSRGTKGVYPGCPLSSPDRARSLRGRTAPPLEHVLEAPRPPSTLRGKSAYSPGASEIEGGDEEVPNTCPPIPIQRHSACACLHVCVTSTDQALTLPVHLTFAPSLSSEAYHHPPSLPSSASTTPSQSNPSSPLPCPRETASLSHQLRPPHLRC